MARSEVLARVQHSHSPVTLLSLVFESRPTKQILDGLQHHTVSTGVLSLKAYDAVLLLRQFLWDLRVRTFYGDFFGWGSTLKS